MGAKEVVAKTEEAVEVAEKDVVQIAEKVSGLIEVKLIDETKEFLTAFTSKGIVNFEKGIAQVTSEIAGELKSHGIIQ